MAIRYTERLAANGVVNSVGSKGDSYDNALAETMFGLYKAELVRNKGPWRGLDDLEYSYDSRSFPEWIATLTRIVTNGKSANPVCDAPFQ